MKAQYPGNLADDYLALKAKQAELAKEEKALKDAILAAVRPQSRPILEGVYGRVSVGFIPATLATDYKAAAEACLTPAMLAQYTKRKAGAIRFVVNARVQDASVAA